MDHHRPTTATSDVSMFEIVKSRVQSKPDALLHKIRDHPGGKPFSSNICLGCGKNASAAGSTVFMTCARCKAVTYCCRECQLLDWKGLGAGPTRPRRHRDMCPELREAAEEFRSHPTAGGPFLRRRLFGPWADQHHPVEGTFHLHEFLARKNLLGGEEAGFWAVPDVLTPYHAAGTDRRGFRNGQMLLKEAFPTMIEGWTAALDETERVDVTRAPPNPLPDGGIRGWEDYVQLRNLSATSVAPLLMTNVLTLYQMIQHELQLPALEKSLKVYVLAVESELNQIPLLQELLYLLPGIDLELILLSPAAKAICDEARGKSSILTRQNFTVLDVQAGAGGRLRVKVDPACGLYDEVPHGIVPDAVLALNAGLGSYPAWAPALHKILRAGTPFCFSDQTRLIHRFTETDWLPSVVTTINNAFPNYRQLQVPDVTIQLNPFHGIVGRDVAYVMAPNISNGYLITAFPE